MKGPPPTLYFGAESAQAQLQGRWRLKFRTQMRTVAHFAYGKEGGPRGGELFYSVFVQVSQRPKCCFFVQCFTLALCK